uniref:RING-type domain-containing protein n=1 Tax=Paramormyrops kingsleyae TaxID=1676925 RepID=A0A3B3RLE6_9TELE
MYSLLSLEEELNCSICLSVFDNPVTTPCGHNFCQDCLDKTWQDNDQVALGFSCPQCRTHFYTKEDPHSYHSDEGAAVCTEGGCLSLGWILFNQILHLFE